MRCRCGTGYRARLKFPKNPTSSGTSPQLERLYARLEDEYELKERAESLNRKLAVIAETAQVLTDIIDTGRSLRLELIIVFLILFEVLITIYQLAIARHG